MKSYTITSLKMAQTEPQPSNVLFNRLLRKQKTPPQQFSTQAPTIDVASPSSNPQGSDVNNIKKSLSAIESQLVLLKHRLEKLEAEREELQDQIKPKYKIKEAVIDTVLYDDPLFHLKVELDDLILREILAKDFEQRKMEYLQKIADFQAILECAINNRLKQENFNWHKQTIDALLKKLNASFEELNKSHDMLFELNHNLSNDFIDKLNLLIEKLNEIMLKFRQMINSRMESKVPLSRIKVIESDIEKMLIKKNEELKKYDAEIYKCRKEIKKLNHERDNLTIIRNKIKNSDMKKSPLSPVASHSTSVKETDSLSQHLDGESKKFIIKVTPPVKTNSATRQGIKEKWASAYHLYAKDGNRDRLKTLNAKTSSSQEPIEEKNASLIVSKTTEVVVKPRTRLKIHSPFQASGQSIIANQSGSTFVIKR